MRVFSIISNRKELGKTHFAACAISSLIPSGKIVAYYKPFIMNAIGGRLFDVEYIKRKTYLDVKDIYTTFATPSNISPMTSTTQLIDTREIIDTIEEMKNEYGICFLETVGLYDPLNENETQTDLLYSISDVVDDMSAIVVSAYDENVISNTLMLIEAMHIRKIKTSLVVINQIRDCIIDDNVIEYLRKQINPINIYLLPFDSTQQNQKLDYSVGNELSRIIEKL